MHLPSNHEVHVWCIALEKIFRSDDEMLPVLSGDERARAERIRHARTKDCFVRSHFALRHILSDYLARSPQAIEFRIQSRGKPEVDGLEFSLSHSEDFALVAVSRAMKLGVDIEAVRPIERLDEIVNRYMTNDEKSEIFASSSKVDTFFEVWAKKEALAKATGDGLSGFEMVPSGLVVTSLVVPTGYAGALAAQGSAINVAYLDFSLA